MNFHSNERGFAMLEAVLAIAVIGILATIVIPKLDRALDEVYVDYEIRGLHSLVHYTQSVNRMNSYKPFGMGTPTGYSVKIVELSVINGYNKTNCYSVREYLQTERIKSQRYLERGFVLQLTNLDSSIYFGADGNSTKNGSITLRKDNIVRRLILTNYGRSRISLTHSE